jgi:hypothetical protein
MLVPSGRQLERLDTKAEHEKDERYNGSDVSLCITGEILFVIPI